MLKMCQKLLKIAIFDIFRFFLVEKSFFLPLKKASIEIYAQFHPYKGAYLNQNIHKGTIRRPISDKKQPNKRFFRPDRPASFKKTSVFLEKKT